MKHVLLTGADGFIGSHLAEALVREGYKVRAFALYNSLGTRGWLDRIPQEIQSEIEVFSGDIRDPFGVRTSMQGCDTVLHLAALIAIPYSYHSPASYVETNISGTLNLLQAARDLDVETFVHTSTSEVYGTAQQVPINEHHPLQAQSPYAASKVGADQLALSFYRSFELPVAVIRPFNTYGPRQSARAVIPTIITQLAAGAERIRLGAVSPTRDFNYIDDTVSGFLAVARAPKAVGEVTNIGSGYEISIGDTAKLIAELMGVQCVIDTDEQRLRPQMSEVERLCACNRKAHDMLGWKPGFAGNDGLRKGLKRTIEWFSRPEHLAYYRVNDYAL